MCDISRSHYTIIYHYQYIVASASVTHICQTCTLAHHLSLGNSMVRASYWSSEGCRFDPRLGLRNCFSEYRAQRSFVYLIYTNFMHFSYLIYIDNACICEHYANNVYVSNIDIVSKKKKKPRIICEITNYLIKIIIIIYK